MVKKNEKTKNVKKFSKQKTHIKSKAANNSQNKIKETVRVKTFIVEKPVYIETPSRFARMRRHLPRYAGEESRYSKRSEEDFEEDFDESVEKNKSSKKTKDYGKDDYSDSSIDEPIDGEENFDDGSELDESMQEGNGDLGDGLEEPQSVGGHLRSRGLFENVWWKKGMLKGFFLWVVIVIFVYLLDVLGMAQVVDAKRWLFFLVLLLILGMGYQKYLSGKVSF